MCSHAHSARAPALMHRVCCCSACLKVRQLCPTATNAPSMIRSQRHQLFGPIQTGPIHGAHCADLLGYSLGTLTCEEANNKHSINGHTRLGAP